MQACAKILEGRLTAREASGVQLRLLHLAVRVQLILAPASLHLPAAFHDLRLGM